MPQTCTVFYGKELVRTTPAGELDLDATVGRFRHHAAPGEHEVCAVLIDLRDAPCRVTRAHADALSRELGRVDRHFVGHVAILYAEAAEAEAPPPGLPPEGRYRVGYFREMNDAITWMTAHDAAAAGHPA